LCVLGNDWDDPVPDNVRSRWELWQQEVISLKDFKIDRCYKINEFGSPKYIELHYFSDASIVGYGQCSYLRQVDHEGRVCCSFVFWKARVIPLKAVTIPRLELAAAVISATVSRTLVKKLGFQDLQEFFWTDSQWRHVKGADNPADRASRGRTVAQLMDSPRWLTGPEFLWETELPRMEDIELVISKNDPEVKPTICYLALNDDKPRLIDVTRFSSWMKLRRIMAFCLRFKDNLKMRVAATEP
jgi:hypothetical protein